jgi:hypothetical protein
VSDHERHIKHAASRGMVRLRDGRIGRLVFWPNADAIQFAKIQFTHQNDKSHFEKVGVAEITEFIQEAPCP